MSRLATRSAALVCLTLATLALAAPAAHAERLRFAHQNAEGGVTRGFGAAHAGQAASGARGHVLRTDGQGNGSVTSGAAVSTANGGQFKRAGHTTRSADGSMQHDSGFTGSNGKGSVQSQGSATRDAQGDVTQNRTTSATSASTGNSAVSTSSYSKDGGFEHSVNCFDANGAAMNCPKK